MGWYREFCFQGKRKDNNEWVVGQLLETPVSRFIVTGCCQNLHRPQQIYVTAWEVKPETVCMFTGFLDLEGNMVFEGDFFQHCVNPEETVIIAWDKTTAGFYLKFKNFRYEEGNDHYAYLDEYSQTPKDDQVILGVKILGNIHDEVE
jgi:hypothetical protein